MVTHMITRAPRATPASTGPDGSASRPDLLACAVDVARRFGSRRVGLEHLLLVLCGGTEPVAAPYRAQAERLGVPCDHLRVVLEGQLGGSRRAGRVRGRRFPPVEVSPSVGLALRAAQRRGHGLDVGLLLSVVLAEFDEPAGTALREVGFDDEQLDGRAARPPARSGPAAAPQRPTPADPERTGLSGRPGAPGVPGVPDVVGVPSAVVPPWATGALGRVGRDGSARRAQVGSVGTRRARH